MNDASEGTDPTEPAETAHQGDIPAQAAPRKFGLDAVLSDAKKVITDPVGFYRGMATSGGFAEPVIFVIVMGLASGLLIALFSLLGLGPTVGMGVGVLAVIFMPVSAVIGSFIGSVFMFVIWKLMGSEQGFEGSYRSVAHASAIYPVMAVVGLIPYLGTIVGVVWGIYLMYCATTQVHKIAQGKAKMVMGIIGAVMLLFQLSGEIATRNLQAQMESKVEQMGGSMEDIGKAMEQLGTSMEGVNPEDMTPEEAGKAVGDFFRGMNEAIQKAEAEAAAAEAAESKE